MIVYFFGVGLFLGCFNFVLKCIVEDGEREFGVKVVEILRKNFYVDDVLSLVLIEKDVVELV